MKGEPLMKIDGWCLVDASSIDDATKSLIDGQEFVSFIWHDCESLKFEYKDAVVNGSEVRYLDAEDSVMGKCWYCMEDAPHEVHTVWTIHNMDFIHAIPERPGGNSWLTKYRVGREEDIKYKKKKAREEEFYDG